MVDDESILNREPSHDQKLQILNAEGEIVNEELMPDLTDEEMLDMYGTMKLIRKFDDKCIKLQRRGEMGTYPPLAGQEASQIGSAFALREDDWIIPSYREQGVQYERGVDLSKIMAYWMGTEKGANYDDDVNSMSPAIPIGSQLPHASGMALSSKLNGEDHAFACFFGDGATSEGDFHEGMNFAGVYNLPLVFFCNNNQWAISVPRERQTASNTLAQKANAYGFEGIVVDGMDIFAVYQAMKAALKKTEDSSWEMNPTMIEAVQYRFRAHTTADDPSEYRDDEEVEEWKEKGPILRLEKYLKSEGLLDEDKIQSIEEEAEDRLSEVVEEAQDIRDDHNPEDMFKHVYDEETQNLREQREKHFDNKGD